MGERFFYAQDVFDILTRNIHDGFYSSIFKSDYKPDYPYDLYKQDNDIYIELPVIGINKDDIKIKVEKDVLRISCNKDNEKITNRDYYVKRITRKNFDIPFKIDGDFDINSIDATVDKGLLRIKIPASIESKSNYFDVKIK